MKILVGIKRVVDFNVRIRVKSDGSGIDTDGVKMSINPFDEIALEQALRIREAGQAEEVIVVSLGGNECQQQLRTGLARGAERAIQVDPTNPVAYLAISRHLIERYDAERGLEVLDQAEGLFGGDEAVASGADAHLIGLRGAALARTGREAEAKVLLVRAKRLAPVVWSDEWLTAEELR